MSFNFSVPASRNYKALVVPRGSIFVEARRMGMLSIRVVLLSIYRMGYVCIYIYVWIRQLTLIGCYGMVGLWVREDLGDIARHHWSSLRTHTSGNHIQVIRAHFATWRTH